MQISIGKISGASGFGACVRNGTRIFVLAMLSVACAGCASPGPPLPPSLNLPEPPAASSLSAERAGATVIVRWMTPERTTDRLLIKGPVQAEICREVLGLSTGQRAEGLKAGSQGGSAGGSAGDEKPCSPVIAMVSAKPGATGEAVDTLPANLANGALRLLAYRVQLKNLAGRTAGPSREAFAAAGDAPAAVANFHARDAKAGVMLEWTTEVGASGDAVELERTEMGEPEATRGRNADRVSALSSRKEPAEIRLRAGEDAAIDPGGTIDRSAEIGKTYSYTAWRVRTVQAGGQRLEIHSVISPVMTVNAEDIFAPDVPAELVAVPAFIGEGTAARSAIDLSWEPNNEPRVAGYRVYRRDGGEANSGDWRLVSGVQTLATAAYRDAEVMPGRRYSYRVRAVGANGMESAPSVEASETAATP